MSASERVGTDRLLAEGWSGPLPIVRVEGGLPPPRVNVPLLLRLDGPPETWRARADSWLFFRLRPGMPRDLPLVATWDADGMAAPRVPAGCQIIVGLGLAPVAGGIACLRRAGAALCRPLLWQYGRWWVDFSHDETAPLSAVDYLGLVLETRQAQPHSHVRCVGDGVI